MSMTAPQHNAGGPLHDDLVTLVRLTRSAERDLFALLDPARRDASGADGGWSARDLQTHLAAWRAIEARRLEARARGASAPADDPPVDAQVDESNARIHASRAGWSWDEVARDADASAEALIAAIGLSTAEVLCECETDAAGIGANGANHALGHLSDVARLAGDTERYDAFVRGVEEVLRRNHLLPHDSGTMLYNIACHRALTGDLDEARRLLRGAFARRGDLLGFARQDPDLESLRADLDNLAG